MFMSDTHLISLLRAQFEKILMDPDVMVLSELETIEVIISWIQYNYLKRIPNLNVLLDHVSYECIPPSELAALAEKYSHIFDNPVGSCFLREAFKYSSFIFSPCHLTHFFP